MHSLGKDQSHVDTPQSVASNWYAALATLLIFNSHLESLYPRPWLAGDGLLGMSMFLFLSGWGIATSWQQQQRPCMTYFWRRILRIYPSLILAVMLLDWLPLGHAHDWGIREYVTELFYPTQFTYVHFIMPAYVILYPCLKGHRSLITWVALAATTYYVGMYLVHFDGWQSPDLSLGSIPTRYHLASYLVTFLIGAYVGLAQRPAAHRSSTTLTAAASAIVVTATYLAAKFVIVMNQRYEFFPLLHLLSALASWSLFAPLAEFERQLHSWRFANLPTLLGKLSLEVYLVHSLLLELPWVVEHLGPFPFNVPLLLSITVALSIAIRALANAIRTRINSARTTNRVPQA
jgi:peptidoglycan/LPS O-acetylase OafA/YrhL